ncbi:MAG: 2-oxoacid:acceptor oxidoreductase family protein [Syntrophobacteraceae bacterium]
MNGDTQQIIISGLGGQGVLFVTKVLADTALTMGLSILISETHGMAQRGGNVISHLKVSPREGCSFISPLIRPGRADIFIGLHPEAILVHGHYLGPNGEAFCNNCNSSELQFHNLDATAIAFGLNSPVSANLVLLGFSAASGVLFCEPAGIESVLKGYGGKRLEASLIAFRAGCGAASSSAGLP